MSTSRERVTEVIQVGGGSVPLRMYDLRPEIRYRFGKWGPVLNRHVRDGCCRGLGQLCQKMRLALSFGDDSIVIINTTFVENIGIANVGQRIQL